MIYLLLPVFNEEPGIERLIENISGYFTTADQPYSIIAVNDGSSDNTPAILKNLQSKSNLPPHQQTSRCYGGMQILNHKNNLGLGAAIRSGINHISSVIGENDILITMDADNTHPVDLIPYLVKNIQNGSDIVIASRYADKGKEIGLKKLRKILSRGAGLLLRLFFPIKNVRDYTSGYRAYSGKLIKLASGHYKDNLITENGFTCMTEILIKLSKLTTSINEVPLVLRYDLKEGKSKIKILKTIFLYFKIILRLKLEKL
ncbi:MAG: glycosyltransferase family 2 protein [Elusimicrobia bacterium]|nr:glycosyltransferase family 2 protein [Elusimicrobiota bacterium]